MIKARQYLEMWLSEQIPTNEWLRILEDNSEVRDLYNKHTARIKKMEDK